MGKWWWVDRRGQRQKEYQVSEVDSAAGTGMLISFLTKREEAIWVLHGSS